MNAYLVCLAALLTADPAADGWESIYVPSEPADVVARAQSPGAGPAAGTDALLGESSAMQVPVSPSPGYVSPYQGHVMHDPFLGPAGPVATHSNMPTPQYGFGSQMLQLSRYGFQSRVDNGWIPKEYTSGGAPGQGNFGIYELDTELEYTAPTGLGLIGSFTQEFDYRAWTGPSGSVGLPSSVYRIGWDFEIATPQNNSPWYFQAAFNPSLATDFQDTVTSDAWLWDGRGIAFFQYSEQVLFAFGAGYWDRVHDRVIPYAGVLLKPDDRWEFRVMFPESRISYFLGSTGDYGQWLYLRGEYHVEAYEIDRGVPGAQTRDQIEIADWRLLTGLQVDSGYVVGFLEVGVVLDRQVSFKYQTTPNFDIGTAFLGRIGLRF